MATPYHNYNTFRRNDSRQLLSSPNLDDWNRSAMPPHLFAPASRQLDAAYDHLNDELTHNVQRFPAYREETDSHLARVKDEMFDADPGPSTRRPSIPAAYPGGYMYRPSYFDLDSPQDDKSFINWYPRGNATITFLNDRGDIESISDLDPEYFEERCPLLAHAFEPSKSGPKLFLEALTSKTATPFVRFLYTGSYATPSPSDDVYEDVPTSVLLHCQLFRLGDIYDLPDLRQQAYVNVTRQCEFGCSSPNKPIDLCEAIEFAYHHLREHANLIETIICYCVTCFLRHALADDFQFRAMAYNLRAFHQDLCLESMKRSFEDDTAAAIIQMPFKAYIPDTYASREDITADRCTDVVYHFHGNDDYPKKRKRPEMVMQAPSTSGISFALRGRRQEQNPFVIPEEFEDIDLGVGSSKRRASMAEPAQEQGNDSSSESEFEVVPRPAAVEELSSDSDSDADTLVVIDRVPSVSSTQTRLPIRRRPSSITLFNAKGAENPGSESDSDWSLV